MRTLLDDPLTIELARRSHALSHDLELVRQLKAPKLVDYIDAPLLENWSIGRRTEIALVGDVSGHPVCKDGHIVTSGLYLLDEKAGYARTLSRRYRLGRPLRSPA